MKKLNRRDFLKKTALGAAALGMGGLMGKTVYWAVQTPNKNWGCHLINRIDGP